MAQKKNCPWNKLTFSYAVGNGNLKNIKWLKKNNCPWDDGIFQTAAENDNLKNIKWLNENLKN